ncbi:MAG: hypothetical protein ACRC33_04160 [Gemmataceae bacterium]
MKASVVTFASLPDEEAAFLAFLAKTGDVWARAVADETASDPAPVADFIAAHAERLTHNGTMDVYLGFRPDVLAPARREDGSVDPFGACLVGYKRGGYYPGGELAQSNLFFYRGSWAGGEFVTKPEAFLKWAGKVLGWARRHAPERVPVYRCNYETRATAGVAEAAAGGLKVWY